VSVAFYEQVFTCGTYMTVHACHLGEKVWIEWNWTLAEMKLLCLEAVSQSAKKLVLQALRVENS